jgi:hypothetical protein
MFGRIIIFFGAGNFGQKKPPSGPSPEPWLNAHRPADTKNARPRTNRFMYVFIFSSDHRL